MASLGSSLQTPLGKAAREPSASLFRYRFANVEFDESNTTLRVAGEAVTVEPLPLQLLGELLRRPNEVVTRAELFEALWDGRPTVDHVLANAVAKLRRAVGEEAAARIVNLPRVGYRLSGPVERVAVGRNAITAPDALAAGQPVPGREGFRLELPLGNAPGRNVWLARDAKLQTSRVFKFATDGERLAALKREYTVYRLLRHELGDRNDFARVLGVNFSDAPYHLECEYSGLDLAAWAAEGGRLAAMPQPERIALFLQIARAVAAAHGVGVLHKDLKPSNVLIEAGSASGTWLTRLTDFGISRVLEPGRLAELGVTAMGLTMTQGASADSGSGTLLYLAPELLAGQSPTMRSDIYALGLMLYQITVGDLRRPMSTGWERDVDDALLRDDIAAATQGRPADRVASVDELVERIAQQPARRAAADAAAAQAEAARTTARQLELGRARRPWVAAAFVSLAVGLGGSLWYQHRAADALRQAEASASRAQAINDYLVKDLLVSPDLAVAGGRKPVSMIDLLRRGSAAASQRFKDQPLAEAAVRHHLGQTFQRISSPNDAEREYAKAFTLLEPRVPANDLQLLRLRFDHALVYFDLNLPDDGNRLLKEAEQAAGPALLGGRDELAVAAATTHVRMLTWGLPGRDVVAAAKRLVALVDAVAGLDMESRVNARGLLAQAYMAVGDDAAEAATLAELERPPFDAAPGSAIAASRVRMLRAASLRGDGQRAAAERILQDVLAKLQAAPEPSEWHIGYAHSELGHVHLAAHDYERAAASYAAALGPFRAALGDDHQYVRITAINLAEAELLRGRPAAAMALCVEHEPWFRKHATAGVWPHLESTLGRALVGLGRPEEALAHLDKVRKPGGNERPTEVEDFAWPSQAYRGIALMRTARVREGAALLREAKTVLAEAKRLPTGDRYLDRVLAAAL